MLQDKPLQNTLKPYNIGRTELIGLAGLFVVGLAVRLYRSGEPSLWLDELWSVYLTRLPLPDMLRLVSQVDLHPPLYYLLLRVLAPLGQDAFTLRLTSTLFDLAALVPLYLLGRRLAGSRAAWIACGLFTFSSLHVIYAQNVRMYTLLATLLLCSYFLFWRLISEEHPPRWIYPVYLLVSAPTIYLNNFAVLFIATQGLVLLATFRYRRNFWRMGVLWGLLVLIYIPWLATLLTQYGNNTIFYPPTPVELLQSFVSMGGADHVNGPLHFNLVTLEQPWLLIGLVIMVIAGFKQLSDRRPERRFLLILWAVPLLISWSLSQIKPVYADRAFVASSFAFFILVGAAFNHFEWTYKTKTEARKFNPESLLVVAGGLLFGILVVSSLWILLVGGGYIRQDVRGLTETVAAQLAASPGERAYLLFTSFAGAPPPLFDMYAPPGATPIEYGFPQEVEQRLNRGPGRLCGIFSSHGSTYSDPTKQVDRLKQIERLENWLAGRQNKLIYNGLFPETSLQLRCWQY